MSGFGTGISRSSRRDDVFDVKTPNTGMGEAEALEIILIMARGLHYNNDFDWTVDHTEACNVADGMINKLLGEE